MTRLFPPAAGPRVFALPPGVNFIAALADGLDARLAGQPPDAAADVTLLLNTRRAARALESRLAAGPARLLPRIRTVTDLVDDPLLAGADMPPSGPPLARRLELATLVRRLLRETGRAPAAAAFGLSESLAALLDELGGAGIPMESVRTLDAGTHAAHWREALAFLDIAADYAAAETAPTGETRMRAAVEGLARRWTVSPPQEPVIVAGSTGSRAPTRALMRLVASLPQGAVILPGLDADLPDPVWARLGAEEDGGCDHPQHGYRALADALGFDPRAVPAWAPAAPACPERTELIGLALRPAPVTDQWRREAPTLAPVLPAATARLAWIEAPSPRAEADAVALALREAAERGASAALVTPDRTLARRVTARLASWGITPDDSAGRPLALTPPGILLSLLAGVEPDRLAATTLLALLKHPLVNSAPGGRGEHLRLVQALEGDDRGLAGHPPAVDWPRLAAWAGSRGQAATPWIDWLHRTLRAPLPAGPAPLGSLVARHRAAAEAMAAGPDARGDHALWDKAAGEAASALLAEIEAAAQAVPAADPIGLPDYRALLASLLNARAVPEEAVIAHPGIAIWGTLEARSQWADRVVLAGLNEGSWPSLPAPDPWLSRPLRRALGLPPPETLIGLSAHDFSLAAAAPDVVLSRSTRDAEAPTVPSRWLLRLENLLRGIGPGGEAALAGTRARGDAWLALARRLDAPAARVPPARRPAPVPPPEARPTRLSVTQIETLVRDPYAIYARHVLGLRRLDPPGREADALARGTALHAVMEAFLAATQDGLPPDAEDLLRATAERVLSQTTPWPAIRAIWRARLARIAPWLLAGEAERRARAAPLVREVRGRLELPSPPFTVTAIADRIDRGPDGRYAIYDYKSGRVPGEKEAAAFHLQLPLEAAIARLGGFDGVPPAPAFHLALIGLGQSAIREIDPAAADDVLPRLATLLAAYVEGKAGHVARLRPQRIAFAGDYDHLSRYGEWADGDEAPPEPLR